jgi:hypothetical protein
MTIAASPVDKLEFKDVFASACEVMQLGKSATNGVASTAPYGAGRSENGRIREFDRQASAIIADHLEAGFDRRVLCRVHCSQSHCTPTISIKVLILSHRRGPQLNGDFNANQTMKFAPALHGKV